MLTQYGSKFASAHEQHTLFLVMTIRKKQIIYFETQHPFYLHLTVIPDYSTPSDVCMQLLMGEFMTVPY